ncbi:PEP-CTERM sorting domain-containing protein [Nostoc sphaeroides CCNUC1]|uniref:PEP-CTERM sorting domain-containing protein n=1 Tax=Nostoc sphaeroides CCNUC1 TaxID=2653204 RepID=A0A5P8WA69_9NOSO|nr:PEP-CTERM sorting domain-containing protein [Nostoc sphaeroides CCNUC1]
MAALPLTLATKPAIAVSIVTNGGFEQPVIAPGSFTIQNPIPGWSLTPDSAPNAGIEVQNNIAGSPYEGNQFAELDGNAVSGIFQNLATTVGQTYKLEFAFSPRTGVQDNRLNVFWGGNTVANLVANGVQNSDNVWTKYVYDVAATSEITTLKFDNLDELSDSFGAYIDNVSVTPIPEPSTMGGIALCVGFGAFLKTRYSKKDKQIEKA